MQSKSRYSILQLFGNVGTESRNFTIKELIEESAQLQIGTLNWYYVIHAKFSEQ